MKRKASNDDIFSLRKDIFSRLPVEICTEILMYVSANDLLSCSQVSKKLNKICNDEFLWFIKCAQLKLSDFQHVSRRSVSHKMVYLRHVQLLKGWRDGLHAPANIVPVHTNRVITGLDVIDNFAVSTSDDGMVAVFDVLSGKQLHSLSGSGGGGVWSLECFHINDVLYVACGTGEGSIYLWNIGTGMCHFILRGHDKVVRCLATSTLDTRVWLVSGSRDTNLRVWDVAHGTYLRLLTGHTGAVRCVRANSARVISGSYDQTVRVWDVEQGSCIHTLVGHFDRVYTIYLGKKLFLSASLDTTIRMWDNATGICLKVLIGHGSLICAIVMTNDESVVITGSADNSIKVWDVSKGDCILTINNGGDKNLLALTSVQVILDKFIVSSSTDGTVKLWNLSNGSFIREIIKIEYASEGGMIWRAVAKNSCLVCAAGSYNFSESTKLIFLNFLTNIK